MKTLTLLPLLAVLVACGSDIPDDPPSLSLHGTVTNRSTASTARYVDPGIRVLLFAEFPPPSADVLPHATAGVQWDLTKPYTFSLKNIAPFAYTVVAAGVDFSTQDNILYAAFGAYPSSCEALAGNAGIDVEAAPTTSYDIALYDPLVADPCFDTCLLDPRSPYCGAACVVAASDPDPSVYPSLPFCTVICRVQPSAPFCPVSCALDPTLSFCNQVGQ